MWYLYYVEVKRGNAPRTKEDWATTIARFVRLNNAVARVCLLKTEDMGGDPVITFEGDDEVEKALESQAGVVSVKRFDLTAKTCMDGF